jgi:hypothetical protein
MHAAKNTASQTTLSITLTVLNQKAKQLDDQQRAQRVGEDIECNG